MPGQSVRASRRDINAKMRVPTIKIPSAFASLGRRFDVSVFLKSDDCFRPAFDVHRVDKANGLRLAGHYQ